MKRVFIIHEWYGSPDNPSYVSMAQELVKSGLKVYRPAMPNPETPAINEWVSFLMQQVGTPDAGTFFVAHSIGGQAVIRYLSTINSPVGGAVFIAPWFTLKPDCLDSDEDNAVVKPWLETPIDFSKVRQVLTNVFAIFSDNDAYVPIENALTFQKELNARTKIVPNRNHFSVHDGTTEIPEVVPEILKMVKK